MIDKVEIRNWQSLRDVTLELGRFTVLVGSSNVGKSAVVRALRAVASNVRGSDHISHGEKTTAITVRTAEHVITLERSGASGRYRLLTVATGQEETFTKLGGAVPPQITAALRIAPVPSGGASINFADQRDLPYLLASSGAQVARELGELTNATVIFEAVREAVRRRNAHAGTLRTREADLADVSARATAYLDLPVKLARMSQVDEKVATATELSARAIRLRAAIEALTGAQEVLARTIVPVAPDDAPLLSAYQRLTQFRSLLGQWVSANRAVADAATQMARHTEAEQRLTGELHELLVAAGQCPTCGQKVSVADTFESTPRH